jgi:hypothetical protein
MRGVDGSLVRLSCGSCVRQFLVFANRLAAILVAIALTSWSKARGHPQGTAPMYQFFFPAFGNVCSSYSAYEALKHVSFPLQVLTKASKLIPVMIMGKIVQRKRYETKEYVQACILTFGVALFFYSEQTASGKANDASNSLYGLFLLTVYILADSFTSQVRNANCAPPFLGLAFADLVVDPNACCGTAVPRQDQQDVPCHRVRDDVRHELLFHHRHLRGVDCHP